VGVPKADFDRVKEDLMKKEKELNEATKLG